MSFTQALLGFEIGAFDLFLCNGIKNTSTKGRDKEAQLAPKTSSERRAERVLRLGIPALRS